MLISKNLIAKALSDPIGPQPQHQCKTCFQCSRGLSRGVQPDRNRVNGNGRFCHIRCVEAFDNGFPPSEPERPKFSLSILGQGFAIQCAHCQQTFSSKGLRCCSAECERQSRETQSVKATMAEAGAERLFVNRKCAAPGCGNDIPRYVGAGKKRRESRTRFCSAACQRRARRAA
jgi:hypothetical protein